MGTAFSVLIRLELSGPGVQFIADNQLYNSIITAHAIIMSAPLCGDFWLVDSRLTNENSCIKSCQAGGVKLHEETRTAKLTEKGVNGTGAQVLDCTPQLSCTTFRITNLIRNIHRNGIFVE